MASHTQLIAELRRSTRAARARKPQPYAHLTKAQLAAQYDELRARLSRAADKANDLGRDLRHLSGLVLMEDQGKVRDASDRAYAVRDILRGDAP